MLFYFMCHFSQVSSSVLSQVPVWPGVFYCSIPGASLARPWFCSMSGASLSQSFVLVYLRAQFSQVSCAVLSQVPVCPSLLCCFVSGASLTRSLVLLYCRCQFSKIYLFCSILGASLARSLVLLYLRCQFGKISCAALSQVPVQRVFLCSSPIPLCISSLGLSWLSKPDKRIIKYFRRSPTADPAATELSKFTLGSDLFK